MEKSKIKEIINNKKIIKNNKKNNNKNIYFSREIIYNYIQINNNKEKFHNTIYNNIKLKNYYFIGFFFTFILTLIKISLSNEKILKLRNLQYVSEITITIVGKGDKYILNNQSFVMEKVEYNFNNIPDQILINGVLQNYSGNMVYNLEKEENNITMRFNNLLTECNVMFLNLYDITRIDLSRFDSSKVTRMAGMFHGCFSLTSINFNKFNTSLVTDMHRMFQFCDKLTSLNLSSFDTSSVKDMYGMFYSLYKLTSIDLSNFNTSSVKDMAVMFYNCSSLKSLDLRSFNTTSNINYHGMFKYCSSLISLNLDSFNTSSAGNMNFMFSGCTSLISLNLKNFQFSSTNYIFNMFDDFNKNNIACIDETKAALIVNNLQKYNQNYTNNCSDNCFTGTNNKFIIEKNLCIDDCSKDEKYKFEYQNICYESDPEYSYNLSIINNTKTNFIPNWDINNFFNGSIELSNLNSTIKDEIIDNIKNDIEKGRINLTNLIEGDKNDLILKEKDAIYQITSTENQNNKNYEDISTIQLGECENILKAIYKIDTNLPLLIFKIDYYAPGLSIPVIGYEIFHPKNKTKLDLNYCKNKIINFNIPVNVEKENLFKYDPNNEYYTDECFSYSTDEGTDILLKDRKNEYNNNNFSLCEKNCLFDELDSDTGKVKCNCEIKSEDFSVTKAINDKNILSTYNFTDQRYSPNIVAMKCVYTLFSKQGLSNNIGNYIMISIIILFIIILVLFYKVGYVLLLNDIKKILKLEQEKVNKTNNNINLYTVKKESKSIKSEKNIKKYKKRKKKKSLSKKSNDIKIGKKSSSSIINLKNEKNIKFSDLEKYETEFKIENLNDYELNTLSYNDALKFDKRTFFKYYNSLLKTKHPLIFSFIPINDYNSILIKIALFLILFTIIYIINAIFFTEATIHQIYKDEGLYNFIYFLPKIFGAFLISHFLYVLIKYLSLSEKYLVEIKRNAKDLDKVDKLKKNLGIKYTIFFIISLSLLILFWYYLSSFCALFKSSQIYLIKNTSISLFISFIYPFFFNILPCIFRMISLININNNRECLYKISNFLQLI